MEDVRSEIRIDQNDASMSDKRLLGYAIKSLNGAFKKNFVRCGMEAGLDEITLMHGWIMGYLYHNSERDIYQKTIESEFGIQRSTVTSILQLMEKKGYISREAVHGDARLKKIVLTPLGKEKAIKTENMIDNMETDIIQGIDYEKLKVFYEVADLLRKKMDGEKNYKSKKPLSGFK